MTIILQDRKLKVICWSLGISRFVGALSTNPNAIIKKAKVKKVLSKTSIEKSALVSKYNYRYYNLKYINQLSKQLQIDIRNFQTLSFSICTYSIFR